MGRPRLLHRLPLKSLTGYALVILSLALLASPDAFSGREGNTLPSCMRNGIWQRLHNSRREKGIPTRDTMFSGKL